MYKYTAHPDVLRKYRRATCRAERPWDAEFFLALEITGTPAAYFACGGFWKKYHALEFYSKERRTHVPLNGVLLDAKWFLETKV